MKYLHEQKICHRDIKAENFLLSHESEDEMGLIDFGMSYEWRDEMSEDMFDDGENKVMGSSYYIAPEVHYRDYDQRCDIWSLGVLLYIMTTATPPFDGNDDNEIAQNVKKRNLVKGINSKIQTVSSSNLRLCSKI